MNLLLDVISPIPEFSVIYENKIILSSQILQSEEEKLSDTIIPCYLKINKKLNISKKLQSVIVTTGPGSYTSLRVGISFILGLYLSKNIKIAGISSLNLLNFKISSNSNLNYGIYIESAKDQKFICYKLPNQKFKHIKLSSNGFEKYDDLKKIDFLYYNCNKINSSKYNSKQIQYSIKKNILNNLNKIKYNNDSDTLMPVYISNNQILD